MSAEAVRSTHIRINSADRSSGYTHDFSVNAPTRRELRRVTGLQILHCGLVNNFYNIHSANNELLVRAQRTDLTWSGDQIIVLPIGNRTIEQLTEFIQAELTELFPAIEWTVGVNAQYSKIYVARSTNIVAACENLLFRSASSAAELLGLSSDVLHARTHTAVFPSCFDLSGPGFIYVHSTALSNGTIDMSSDGKILHSLCAIRLNNFGDWSFFQPDNSTITFDSPKQLNNVDIRLRDGKGRVLDNNGGTFDLMCRIFYVLD